MRGVVSVPSRALCVLRPCETESAAWAVYQEERVSVPSRALCVLRLCSWFTSLSAVVLRTFQCPLELCVFCDDDIEIAFNVSYFVGFQCPLELCVFCDWFRAVTLVREARVSVPSRALCVLRH